MKPKQKKSKLPDKWAGDPPENVWFVPPEVSEKWTLEELKNPGAVVAGLSNYYGIPDFQKALAHLVLNTISEILIRYRYDFTAEPTKRKWWDEFWMGWEKQKTNFLKEWRIEKEK